MMRHLEEVQVFLTVADTGGFRAAGEKLSVSGSAVSGAVRRLEKSLGITLLHRSTRSVRLTEAGERLRAAARPALDNLEDALDAVGELGGEARRRLRLDVSGYATRFLGEVLRGFMKKHPQVRLALQVGGTPKDIVSEGYDAGIRLREMIEKDMIAMPTSGAQRLVVVGAPSYLEQHPPPKHPRDLVDHVCIAWQPRPDAPPLAWEFSDGSRKLKVPVRGTIASNDIPLIVSLTRDGFGLSLHIEEAIQPYIERGELVPVLEAYCKSYESFYLYYPSRRHTSPELRALIEYLKTPAPD